MSVGYRNKNEATAQHSFCIFIGKLESAFNAAGAGGEKGKRNFP